MDDGRDCVIVDIDPPLIRQNFGLGDQDISTLVLTPRWKTIEIPDEIQESVYVLVYRTLDQSVLGGNVIDNSKLELVAWCELYPGADAAEQAIRRMNNV